MEPITITSEDAKRLLDAVISDLLELTRDNDSFLLSASVARLEALRDQYLIPRLAPSHAESDSVA